MGGCITKVFLMREAGGWLGGDGLGGLGSSGLGGGVVGGGVLGGYGGGCGRSERVYAKLQDETVAREMLLTENFLDKNL